MQRIGKMLLALAVVFLVFGGTNAFATSRGCALRNAKTVESLDCTVNSSTNKYKITANHSSYSNSDELEVGLNEWNTKYHKNKYKLACTLKKYYPITLYPPASNFCKWAKLRLTACSKKATGTGIISN